MSRPKPVREWKLWAGTLGLIAVLAVIAACDIELPVSSPTDPPAASHAPTLTPAATPTSGPLLVAAPTALPSGLPQLTIRAVPGALPKYDRDDWRHWVDDDRDCQNARHETLVEESRIAVTFTNEDRCSVATGEWLDPFTGDILTSARDLDVDHMVPLSNAHRSGAWAWDDARRRAFANDLSYANHLIAVTNSVNRSKSDQGPERWKPPDESYWCQYAIDWATIKADWGLSATPPEWDALLAMAATCGGELPPSPTPRPTATLAPGTTVYASCDEAEQAGVPRRQGTQGSGYGFPAETVPSARDGDKDGVVCERTGAAAPSAAPTPTAAPSATTAARAVSDAAIYPSCEEAEQAGVPRQQGSQGPGYGFPAETVPSARDGDKDGVVCERTGAAAPTSVPTQTPAEDSRVAEDATVYASCEEAEQAGVPRQQGSSSGGRGFPADLVPSARDGDGDGVVCER